MTLPTLFLLPLLLQPTDLAELETLSARKQLFELREAVNAIPATNDPELMFFFAQVDEKFNRLESSNSKFSAYLAHKGKKREQALSAMASNYSKLGQYKKAGETYRQLLDSGQPISDRKDVENVAGLWSALADVPPQTVSIVKDSEIPFGANFTLPITSNGQTLDFIFDTGANISTVSETYAAKLGLKIVDQTVQVGNITGSEVPARLGVSKELRIGNAIVNNAIFLVFKDKDLYIEQAKFQINAVLGFPVISALREITITRDKHLIIPSKATAKGLSNMALDNLTPMVLGYYDSQPFTFAFDSGANTSMLYPPFFRKFKNEVSKWPKVDHRFAGVGAIKSVPAHLGQDLKLKVGGQQVIFPKVPVLTEPTTPNSKLVYGNLGQDMIRQFKSVTISFEKMSLEFGERAADASAARKNVAARL